MGFLERSKQPKDAITFVETKDGQKVTQTPISFFNENINQENQYAILRTTENGKYIRGNMLFYSLKGVEIYTELNNIIFVDELNNTLFVRDYSKAVNAIAPDDPEQKQYVVLYTDLDFSEDYETPLRWESYIGRLSCYEAIKSNLSIINIDKSLVLVDNVALKDSLSVREFIEYLINADIVDDEIDLNEYYIDSQEGDN